MDIQADGDVFGVTLTAAEVGALMNLAATLGDHDEDWTFHWPEALSPTRECIIERVSLAFEAPGQQEQPTQPMSLSAGEMDVLGQMFSHGARELDDDFETIIGWPPAAATDAADHVVGALSR